MKDVLLSRKTRVCGSIIHRELLVNWKDSSNRDFIDSAIWSSVFWTRTSLPCLGLELQWAYDLHPPCCFLRSYSLELFTINYGMVIIITIFIPEETLAVLRNSEHDFLPNRSASNPNCLQNFICSAY
jgi:hypothetical protein